MEYTVSPRRAETLPDMRDDPLNILRDKYAGKTQKGIFYAK